MSVSKDLKRLRKLGYNSKTVMAAALKLKTK